MSEGEKEARTHMVEIWEGEEIWGDFYAKLLYEGRRRRKRAPSVKRINCPRQRCTAPAPESRLISGRCYPS